MKIAYIATLLVAGACHADDGRTYLRCPIDGRPTAPGYDIVIDKAQQILAQVLPGGGESPMPMDEKATAYIGSLEANGKVQVRFTINKYTLRFTAYSTYPTAETVSGQCEVVSRKL